jgi:RNA polymerase sigma factor (sigma-70 family)
MPAHHAPLAGDDLLVARVREGDQEAFEAIYDRYSRGLLAFCRHMLGSRDEAEDALQHSFVSAYRGLRDGGGEIALKPWLYAIARNRCLSALRARHPESVEIGDVEAGHQAYDGLVAEVQRRAELRDLVDDVQRLPADQRAALVLFELGDHSHAEIAEVLGVRREKVKALVFQAREALLRARSARDTPCGEIREELAALSGEVPRRGMVRGHVDRCPGCADFELRVRRQRRALAAVLPVVPSVGLKASVLGSVLGGAAAAGGAGAGGAAVVGGTAVGGGSGAAAAGGVGAGGLTGGLGGAAAAGFAGGAGAGAGTAGVAGGVATAGAGAASVASGLATAGAGAAGAATSVATKGMVAKILTAVVVAGAGGGAGAAVPQSHPARAPVAAVEQPMVAPAIPVP